MCTGWFMKNKGQGDGFYDLYVYDGWLIYCDSFDNY